MNTQVRLEYLGNYYFKTVSDLEFQTDTLGKVIVPTGFITDLASTPRLLWSFFPPHGSYLEAAILHDYLYVSGIADRPVSDKTFYEVMQKSNVPYYRRKILYYGVKLFGSKRYKELRK